MKAGSTPRQQALTDDGYYGYETGRESTRLQPLVEGELGGATMRQPRANTRADALELTPGMRIDHYELIREIGRGGMGRVFAARDVQLGRLVALKFLRVEVGKTAINEILAEARATAACQHENIVVIYGVGEHEGSPYMALEFLDGRSLVAMVGSPISVGRAVELTVPVVRALGRAHQAGIVHRDLKPENVFVTNTGAVKVVDFGIAKLLQHWDRPVPSGFLEEEEDPEDAETQIPHIPGHLELRNETIERGGHVFGTPHYMAPEQYRIGQSDHRSDFFAVGMILVELIAGDHPYADASLGQLIELARHLDEPLPSSRHWIPEAPIELIHVIDRCLAKRKEDRWQDAEELLQALEPLAPGRRRHLEVEPYPGLSAFQEADAAIFFGRDREIAMVRRRLELEPLVILSGPSGAGKSSLIRAGLIPALREEDTNHEVLITRPARRPMAELSALVAPLFGEGRSATALERRLRTHPGELGALLRERARRRDSQITLFIDQFEELFTLGGRDDTDALLACLQGIADDATSPLRVILSVRSDFLDRLAAEPFLLRGLSRGLVFLLPPTGEAMVEAITGPADLAGYAFEAGLVEDMCHELQEVEGALPLLQAAASTLWRERDRQRQLLTREAYEAMGGVGGALATHADAVTNALGTRAADSLRRVFLRLVTAERTRGMATLAELEGLDPNANMATLLSHLVEARLLTVQSSSLDEEPAYEIIHESLIASWPTLRRWLDAGAEDQLMLEQIGAAAKQWDQRGRSNGLLWSGDVLEDARRWRDRFGGSLPRLDAAFLDAAAVVVDRIKRRRRRMVIGSFFTLVLLLAAAGAGLVYVQEARQSAITERDKAQRAEVEIKRQRDEIQRQFERVNEEQRRREAAQQAERRAAKAAADQQALREQAEKEKGKVEEDLADNREQLRQQLVEAGRARREAEKATMVATKASAELKEKNAALKKRNRELERRLKRISTGDLR